MRVITGLFVYPIKSCRGIDLSEATLDNRGLTHDRRWMVVDTEGNFLTQREHPVLARVIPRFLKDALTIEIQGDASMQVTIPRSSWEGSDRIPVTIWGDLAMGVDQGAEANEFFSTLLHKPARLVRMPEDECRVPNRRPEGVNAHVGFADGYPLLVTTEESLAFLNEHLPVDQSAIPMARFRPNIVLRGAFSPWEEERWRTFRVNHILFYGIKPCERCSIIQVDQRTGVRMGKSPLETLAKVHRVNKKPSFGINVIHATPGYLYVGAPVAPVEFDSAFDSSVL
ncbi:MAG: hypothetical protein RL141_850 [Candidatus Parcubacteria bacterium]|jgi:uncharacterized protein YcbX